MRAEAAERIVKQRWAIRHCLKASLQFRSAFQPCPQLGEIARPAAPGRHAPQRPLHIRQALQRIPDPLAQQRVALEPGDEIQPRLDGLPRSEEHTSELQSLMRISYAVFCLLKNNHTSIYN